MSKDEIKELFGVSEKDLEKGKDINPSLNLKQWFDLGNTSIELTFNEEKPKTIEFQKKNTQGELETKKASVITVSFDNLKYTLWLSSKTLSMGIARVFAKSKNNLDGVTVRINRTNAEHDVYGDYWAYNVFIIE